VVAYEMLADVRPFAGASIVTANRLLDEKRKNILVALLQSTPALVEIQEP
jgi:hypothetical protein